MEQKKNSKDFKVLILAGGYGTRLYPITLNVPKPLLKIGKKAIIDFSLMELEKFPDLKDIYVVANDRFYKDFYQWKKGLKTKKKITVINDGTKNPEERLGAVGDIYYVIKKEKISSNLLVIGADNIFEKDLGRFIEFSQDKGKNASMGIYDLKNKRRASRYGVAKLNKKGEIIDFEEKPKHPKSSHVAMCMYYFPAATIRYFKEYADVLKLNADKTGFYIKWLMTKVKVFGFDFGGKWLDIGQIDTYNEAKKIFSNVG